MLSEGESLPGAIPPTGNTNTHARFPPDLPTFIENWGLAGPTHHFALGVGHIARPVSDLARSFGIECVNVTDPSYRRPQYIHRGSWPPRAPEEAASVSSRDVFGQQ